MIVKSHQMSYSLKQLEALLRRLPVNHPKYKKLHEWYTKRMAGNKGEELVLYPISSLPNEDYFIFHDLRLFNGLDYFQLDFLILSTQLAIIMEVKNIAGKLRFQPNFHQLIRVKLGVEEVFPDPINQVERQSEQLERFLDNCSIPKLPIESIVVISSPRSIIEMDHNQSLIAKKVIHAASLPATISSLKKKYKKQTISKDLLSEISTFLIENNTPLKQNILEKQKISPFELIKGVICPKCNCVPMNRKRGFWFCESCRTTSKDEHLNALIDYAYIINSYISNGKTRSFLQLQSESTARKILTELNCQSFGEKKGRNYKISFLLDNS
jgi:ribosomal protein L37AE/L43A